MRTKTKSKAPARPSLAAALLAEGSSARGLKWSFPPEAIADIEEVKKINASGEGYIARSRLARAIVKRYKLPAGWRAVAERIKTDHGW